MIIGIDASRANRQFKTGVEWYSYFLIESLARLDKDNKYRLYTDKALSPDIKEFLANRNNFSVRFLSWPFGAFWNLIRLSWEMIWHRPKALFIPAGAMPIIHPKKTFVTIHDIAFKREDQVYDKEAFINHAGRRKGFLNFILKNYFWLSSGRFQFSPTDYLDWSTAYALKKAYKIITVSEFSKQEIIDVYKTPANKIKVIYNGYNPNFKVIDDKEKISELLDSYGIDFPYILYVGRLEKKKNIPLLLEAFALLKERHPEIKEKLVLVGAAGFGYDEIKYIIEEYDLNNDVILLGWTEEAHMPYIYNGAKAFVFPSRHEGFGIPVMQSLVCGLATLCSDIPALREVAGDSVLYFNKDDKRDLADNLYNIISDNELRENLRRSGLERAKFFSWDKAALEMLQLWYEKK